MVKTFCIANKYFAFDVETGSLHQLDKLCYELLQSKLGLHVNLGSYTPEQINEAEQELAELKNNGVLFTDAETVSVSTYSNEVKALCLHICHDCNLRCGYCFADTGAFKGNRSYMSFEVGKNAIDFLIQNSGNRENLEVDFFGGEPLMNFDVVKQIVSYAEEQAKKYCKQFKFTLTTNCMLLDSEIIDYLNEKMDNVVLSIDGREQVHDSMRPTINGKGSFAVAVKRAKEFACKRGTKSYYVRGTFTANNLDFDKDILYLADLGFNQLSVEPVVLDSSSPLSIKREHIETINANYEALAEEYVKRRKNDDTWFNFFHFYIDLQNGPCLKKRLMGCGAGNEYLAVTPNGEIYPCHQFADNKDYVMGNVFERSIDDKIKTKFACSNLTTKPKCADCIAKYFCSGGCSANNINYAGDINTPYELGCEMMRKRLECALYIYAMENGECND